MRRSPMMLALVVVVAAQGAARHGEEGAGRISCALSITEMEQQFLLHRHARTPYELEEELSAGLASAFFSLSAGDDTVVEVYYAANSGKCLGMRLLLMPVPMTAKTEVISKEIQWIEFTADGG